MPEPEYLGDSVYAGKSEFDELVLTTDSHREEEAGNRIVLEPQVIAGLLSYIDRAWAKKS